MNVLWFVNIPFPALQHYLGGSFHGGGGWMLALAAMLCQQMPVKLGIATSWPSFGELVELNSEGITYFGFPPGYKFVPKSSGPLLRTMRAVGSFLKAPDRRTLLSCHQVIQRFRPDVIHVHGSEEAWGLLARNCEVPLVLSMQGILNGYLPVYWGTSPRLSRLLMLSESKYWLEWCLMRAPREREIFRVNRHFLGRTSWDRSWQEVLQPSGKYWHVGELLRPEFYKVKWELSVAERFTLFTTTSNSPLKGTDVLIRALALLRPRYPFAHLRVCGELPHRGWGKYLRELVHELGLERHVTFLGYLDAQQQTKELCRAHVYVLPSHIENSPNSLCEAQLVGVPCVASRVGGVPSLVEHGHTGLLFPRGDHVALAGAVSRVFDADEWASELSIRERVVANPRHAPELVAQNLLRVYREVINTGESFMVSAGASMH
jgi:L-malate glycosyltransferase